RERKAVGDTGGRVAELKRNFPQVFGGIYSEKCQGEHQPIAYRQLEDALATTKPVLPFPAKPDVPLFYFVCSSDQFKYPGVRRNNTGHAEDIYPYVPCCFETDQFKSGNTKTSVYYRETESSIAPSNRPLDVGKVLNADRYGKVSASLSRLLKKYSDKSKEILRYGTPKSPSSIIHAILVAINDVRYLSLSPDDRIDYVDNLRQTMSGLVRPELLKQELYDVEDSIILRDLS